MDPGCNQSQLVTYFMADMGSIWMGGHVFPLVYISVLGCFRRVWALLLRYTYLVLFSLFQGSCFMVYVLWSWFFVSPIRRADSIFLGFFPWLLRC